MNSVSDEVLEALVRYGFRSITCSIDGATEETYQKYRVNGSLAKVLGNIRKLNSIKERYESALPALRWQFIVFGHNEHEIDRARELAEELGMDFSLKLSWDSEFSPVRDQAKVKRELGAASRQEYSRLFGSDYRHFICHELWSFPQINWDGRVLGCCRNFWGEFGGNAFTDGLVTSVNTAGIRYAREMLLGKKPPREGIPCTTCEMYAEMKARGNWVERRIVSPSAIYRLARWVYRTLSRNRALAWFLTRMRRRIFARPESLYPLHSAVYPLTLPLLLDGDQGWAPFPVFKGSSPGLRKWSCHASALAGGVCPHPPHRHNEEEILLLLSGGVDLVLPTVEGGRVSIEPGQFAYYPSGFPHTIEATSRRPANYLMFRWLGERPTRSPAARTFGVFDSGSAGEPGEGYSARLVFQGPSKQVGKVRCHVARLGPGAGYEPHADRHEVAIVVLEGEIETLGIRVVPHGVVLYVAGESHGMRNPADTPARYLVLELHASRPGVLARPLLPAARRLASLRDRRRADSH
jgi:quercetin dioxygenase-like cupin family protein